MIRHIIREAGATFHNIRNGKKLNFGTRAVIKRRDGTSFREFALFVHDFALLFDKDGNALNPPEVPGTHDNPATPILEAYPGDELMIRLLDGAHEEQHSFILTGMTWKKEIDDAWLGLWGIIRAYARPDKHLKPLILRANAGEWIEVTLHNLFDPRKPVPYFDYPSVPLDMKHKPSMRVSINPQYLHYDPVCDSGINVGYNNHEQTVGVGESKKYLWYADQDGELVKTATDDGEEVDDEDTGEKGYNYHSERFANRLIKDHRVSKVFSSRVHGDPATPVFTAYPNERVIFRVLRNNFGHKCKNAC